MLAAALEWPMLHVVQTPMHPGVSGDMDAVLAGVAARGVAIIGNQISFPPSAVWQAAGGRTG